MIEGTDSPIRHPSSNPVSTLCELFDFEDVPYLLCASDYLLVFVIGM